MTNTVKLTDQSLQQLETLAIHNSPMIQPHGLVLVLDEPDLTIAQISSNCQSILGRSPEDLIGQSLEIIFDSVQIEPIQSHIAAGKLDVLNPSKLWARLDGDNFAVFDGVFHRNADGLLIFELETAYSADAMPFLGFYHLANQALIRLQNQAVLSDVYKVIVQEIRRITGFDRVMLYRFDLHNDGEVIAEEKRDEMEPYLGLHYPATDIPQPARHLFIQNPIRVIPDVSAEEVPLYPSVNPVTNQAVDLTESILRSAYSCHLDYLRNMGVGASLTISLIKDGKLWGLIACHHLTPKVIPYELRKACEFFGRVVFNNISAQESTANSDYRVKLAEHEAVLLESINTANGFIEELEANAETAARLMALTGSQGVALCFGERLILLGQTPDATAVQSLLQWLETQDLKDVFSTDCLSQHYASATNYKAVASGLLVIPIARHNFLLWFRPEVLQTVNWGGDPNHAYEAEQQADGKIQLHPRQSFELWKETVQRHSLPWQPIEIQSALAFKKAIINLMLRQAEALAEENQSLSANLERQEVELSEAKAANKLKSEFVSMLSHDFRNPLNTILLSAGLLEESRDRLSQEKQKSYFKLIRTAISDLDDLLSEVLLLGRTENGKVSCQFECLDLMLFCQDLIRLVNSAQSEPRQIDFRPQGNLQQGLWDAHLLRHILCNLLSNAIKYSPAPTPIVFEIIADQETMIFRVSDQGIGIPQTAIAELFDPFFRADNVEEVRGTGLGLAIVQRCAAIHGGEVQVESKENQGSVFTVSCPIVNDDDQVFF